MNNIQTKFAFQFGNISQLFSLIMQKIMS